MQVIFFIMVGGRGGWTRASWIRYCVWSDLQQDNVTGNVGRWSVFDRRQLHRAVIVPPNCYSASISDLRSAGFCAQPTAVM